MIVRYGNLIPRLFFAAFLATLAGEGSLAESLEDVIAAYNAPDNDGGVSAPVRDDATWLAMLTDAADRHRGDPLEATVLGYARLHANVLGKWEESAGILERLLVLEPDRSELRARLLTELGEVRKQVASTTRRDSDSKAARLALEEANAVYGGIQGYSDTDGAVEESILLNRAWISQLLAASEDPADRLAAAASFRSLREGVDRYRATHGEPRHRLAVSGWTPAGIAAQEAMEAMVNEQYAEASEAIQQVARGDDPSITPSQCIINAAYRKTLPARADVGGYVQFLETSLQTLPEDDGTCVVRYLHAEALLQQGNKAGARSILEDLRDNAFVAFDKVEPNALEQGAGGTFSFVLRTLRDMEAEGGDTEKALATNRFYLDLYPNDGGLTVEARSFAERLAAETQLSASPANVSGRRSWRSLLLLGNIALIMILGGWMLFRRRR
jgi:hypothetical protein